VASWDEIELEAIEPIVVDTDREAAGFWQEWSDGSCESRSVSRGGRNVSTRARLRSLRGEASESAERRDGRSEG